MIRNMFAAMFVVGFAFSLSSSAFVQEAMKKESKKEDSKHLDQWRAVQLVVSWYAAMTTQN